MHKLVWPKIQLRLFGVSWRNDTTEPRASSTKLNLSSFLRLTSADSLAKEEQGTAVVNAASHMNKRSYLANVTAEAQAVKYLDWWERFLWPFRWPTLRRPFVGRDIFARWNNKQTKSGSCTAQALAAMLSQETCPVLSPTLHCVHLLELQMKIVNQCLVSASLHSVSALVIQEMRRFPKS